MRKVSERDGTGHALERNAGCNCAVLYGEACRKKAQGIKDDAEDPLSSTVGEGVQ
ncbi:MAG: hypothetical protein O3A81_00890 [bacterium]|nr:hypothetical protein [bacterium]